MLSAGQTLQYLTLYYCSTFRPTYMPLLHTWKIHVTQTVTRLVICMPAILMELFSFTNFAVYVVRQLKECKIVISSQLNYLYLLVRKSLPSCCTADKIMISHHDTV